jgi:ABC-type uncharacterized transport system permease subunit
MISAISSATYLFVVRKLKNKNKLKALYLFPPLARLNDLTGKLVIAGIVTFSTGLAIGLYGSYIHFSSFEPASKHWFAAIVLLYYLAILILKKPLKIVGPRLAIVVIFGFILSIGLILIPDNDLHWLHNTTNTNIEAEK